MQITTLKQAAYLFSLSSLIALTMNAAPAFAKGGPVAGGGAAAGGGGVTQVIPVMTGSTTTGDIKLSNGRQAFNGVYPTGIVTVGYDANGTANNLLICLNNINVPDGTVLSMNSISGRQTIINTPYYTTVGRVYNEIDGNVTVSKGSVTLLLSRANGDVIPDFPLPTVVGTSEVRFIAYTPLQGYVILDGTQGSFRP